MRELAVQSANDTITQQDRSYIQMEIDQLRDEIDRISSATQFNRKKLLDGTSSSLWSSDKLSTEVIIRESLTSRDQFGQKITAEGNFRIEAIANPGQAQVLKSNIFEVSHTQITLDYAPTEGMTPSMPNPPTDSEIPPLREIPPAPTMPVNPTVIDINDPGAPSGEGWTFANEVLTITTNGDYRIAGDNGLVTNNRIVVEPGVQANIILDGVNISHSISYRGAFEMRGATVNLFLEGDNYLTGSRMDASALYAPRGSNLTINSVSLTPGGTLGTLTAISGDHTAGIGGSCTASGNPNGGNITIYGGTIIATGGAGGAGIGGGGWSGAGNGGNIIIAGGTVNATGGNGAAGIGGGSGNGGNGGNITITGGTVNATGGNGGAGIGGGNGNSNNGGDIQIAGGNITANGGGGGRGIGGGSSGGPANIWVYGGYEYERGVDGSVIDTITMSNGGWVYALSGGPPAENVHFLIEVEEVIEDVVFSISEIMRFDSSSRSLSVFFPQTITIYQGDGNKTNVTLYASDTMRDVASKINDAIAFGLGQSVYVDNSVKFSTLSDGTENTSESVYESVPVFGIPDYRRDEDGRVILDANGDPILIIHEPNAVVYMRNEDGSIILDDDGNPIVREPELVGYKCYATLLVRSAIPGAEGELIFSGDEDLLKLLGLATIQESRESEFHVSVYDAHSGKPVSSLQKITGNMFYGAITDSVDVKLDPLANIDVTWNERAKRFEFTSAEGVYTTIVHLSDQSTTFQIGANEGEDMTVAIGNMNARALGVHNILVIDRKSAARAITKIDSAITRVLNQMSKLGAYQNRLEHTVNNLTTASENLTAAESRIRDLDIAKEMMNFTKLDILTQSGQAMLAQANQLPQNILQLLR